jgi:hypothetical protein
MRDKARYRRNDNEAKRLGIGDPWRRASARLLGQRKLQVHEMVMVCDGRTALGFYHSASHHAPSGEAVSKPDNGTGLQPLST